eukprot:4974023-Ditylum_brightwellii.AAC.1
MSVKRKGIFHLLSDEMRETLLMVAMKDAPVAKKSDQTALLMQWEARQCKEELAKEHALESAMEEYTDALYYFGMYGSEACWKSTVIADIKLNKLTGNTAKLRALKENPKDGVEYTPVQLALHLNKIIEQEQLHNIPDNPPAFPPVQKVLPKLGLETADVLALDKICAAGLIEFEHKARTIKLEYGDRDATSCLI